MLDLNDKEYSVVEDDGFTDVLAQIALSSHYEWNSNSSSASFEFSHTGDGATIIYREVHDPDEIEAPEDAQITTPGCMVEVRQGMGAENNETTAIRFVPGVFSARSRTEAMLYAEIFRGIHTGKSKEDIGEIVQKFVLGGKTLKDFGAAEGIKVALPKSSVLPSQWKGYANSVHRMVYGSDLGSVTSLHQETVQQAEALEEAQNDQQASGFSM